MAATITWTIQWMQCKPTDGSLTDVVVTAGWSCAGTQVEGDTTDRKSTRLNSSH